MTLDPELCYRALRTRDARFDGRFFTAVRSTGVYCRPICPARTPRRENCLFLPCAAAAREAGFRPCLRCRPEAAPGTPAWAGTSASVSRALRLIENGALDTGSVAALAGRVGLGERHLRRLFAAHLGASPQALAQTRRLHFAKRLLDETELPMAQVAFASGFASVRRFNAAIHQAYGRAPGALRRRRGAASRAGQRGPDGALELRLSYRPPLDWTGLLAFLAPRAIPGVEEVRGGRYRRSFALEGARGRLEVACHAPAAALRVRVAADAPVPLIALAARLRQLFDLAADPQAIAAQLGRDRRLHALPALAAGVRVPGAWDGFEVAVRVLLGQQVSVAAATRLAGRLVAAYGEPLAGAPSGVSACFPGAEVLAEADPARLGLPATRARALRALACAVARGELALDGSRSPEETRAALEALPGIGPWSAEMIALRALREPDAWPASDLGLCRALGRPGRPAAPARAAARAEAWRPWRAYAAVLLWGA